MNVSEEVKEKIRRIEEVIGEDPGNRGITPLVRESSGSLLAAALDLQSASSVGIVTGFYILACNAPETDGPPGAIAIARALLAMRKKVSIITDIWSERMMTAIQAAAFPQYLDNDGSPPSLMPVTVYPDQESESNSSAFAKEWSEKIIQDHKMDHLLSIERVGPALDGRCHNMRGLDITAYTAPLHSLFDSAEALSMRTTGIGDGGNELGMGKLRELVVQHVPNGEVIGCTTATNNLIVTGVSNWGGYALAASLYLLEQQKNSAESLAKDMLPSRDEESRLLDVILKAGAVDGVLRASVRSVDGMEFDKYAEYLDRINQIALTAQKC